MPLYEYRCEQCEQDFEVLTRVGQTPACPTCHSEKVEKLFSVPAATPSGFALVNPNSCPPPSAGPCGPACCRMPGFSG